MSIYFGAKVAYQAGFMGGAPQGSNMGINGGPIRTFESNAGKQCSVVGINTRWLDNGIAHPFSSYRSLLLDCYNHGRIPSLDWGVWDLAHPANDIYVTYTNIINGATSLLPDGVTTIDQFIRAWAIEARNYAHPMFIRMFHEMNLHTNQFPWQFGTVTFGGNTYTNSPSDHILAWRHIVDIFNSVGATNITWIWCPNVRSASGSSSFLYPFSSFYPGNSHVDWFGLDGYTWSASQSMAEVFLGPAAGNSAYVNSYAEITALGPQPLSIRETGVDGYVNGVINRPARAQTYTEAFQSVFPSMTRLGFIEWFWTYYSAKEWTADLDGAGVNNVDMVAFRNALLAATDEIGAGEFAYPADLTKIQAPTGSSSGGVVGSTHGPYYWGGSFSGALNIPRQMNVVGHLDETIIKVRPYGGGNPGNAENEALARANGILALSDQGRVYAAGYPRDLHREPDLLNSIPSDLVEGLAGVFIDIDSHFTSRTSFALDDAFNLWAWSLPGNNDLDSGGSGGSGGTDPTVPFITLTNVQLFKAGEGYCIAKDFDNHWRAVGRGGDSTTGLSSHHDDGSQNGSWDPIGYVNTVAPYWTRIPFLETLEAGGPDYLISKIVCGNDGGGPITFFQVGSFWYASTNGPEQIFDPLKRNITGIDYWPYVNINLSTSSPNPGIHPMASAYYPIRLTWGSFGVVDVSIADGQFALYQFLDGSVVFISNSYDVYTGGWVQSLVDRNFFNSPLQDVVPPVAPDLTVSPTWQQSQTPYTLTIGDTVLFAGSVRVFWQEAFEAFTGTQVGQTGDPDETFYAVALPDGATSISIEVTMTLDGSQRWGTNTFTGFPRVFASLLDSNRHLTFRMGLSSLPHTDGLMNVVYPDDETDPFFHPHAVRYLIGPYNILPQDRYFLITGDVGADNVTGTMTTVATVFRQSSVTAAALLPGGGAIIGTDGQIYTVGITPDGSLTAEDVSGGNTWNGIKDDELQDVEHFFPTEASYRVYNRSDAWPIPPLAYPIIHRTIEFSPLLAGGRPDPTSYGWPPPASTHSTLVDTVTESFGITELGYRNTTPGGLAEFGQRVWTVIQGTGSGGGIPLPPAQTGSGILSTPIAIAAWFPASPLKPGAQVIG